MLHPESELLFFFILPIKAKWLLAGVLGALFLVNVSSLNLAALLLCFGGVITAYLYGVMAWDLNSPYTFTAKLDGSLSKLSEKIRGASFKKVSNPLGKIIDFHTGKTIDTDEQFVDAMLDKISKTGEQSLTSSERRRLNNISEKKSLYKE